MNPEVKPEITIDRQDETTTIRGVIGDRVKQFTLDTKVWDTIQTITEPTSNGEVQQILAAAMRVPCPGGRSQKAASFLERYTNGYGAFNGWCSLFIATNQGRKRFFQFNRELVPNEDGKAQMLTKIGKKFDPEHTAEAKQQLRIVTNDEDLGVPDNFELGSEEMNEIIDDAYRALGYNPVQLTDDAPDLTFDEAVAVLQKKQGV